mgnify:CR=1 FL=1|tara:strand:- start:13055 stop:13255 length:201 start_codon:yes stop_codon:yes gene_type:complete
MSSKVAKFEEYARKQKEKKSIIQEEVIQLRIENNNLKKEVEKYKKILEELREEVVRERLKVLGFLE